MANEDTFHLGVKALIRNKHGKVLVLHTNMVKLPKGVTDHWDLPGGRLQKGQDLEETLRREIKEEIGIKEIKMYGTSVVFPGIKNQNGKPKTINVKQDNGSAHRAALAIAIKIGDYSGLPVEDHSTDGLGNLEKKL